MKSFTQWLNESITQAVIAQVMKYLEDHTHYDDEFDVSPLMQQLGLKPIEMERIIGLVNQRLQLSDPLGDPSYDFDPKKMTARYSSMDI